MINSKLGYCICGYEVWIEYLWNGKEWIQRRQECPLTLQGWPLPLRWTAYTATIWMTLYWMPQSGGGEFIYFEF